MCKHVIYPFRELVENYMTTEQVTEKHHVALGKHLQKKILLHNIFLAEYFIQRAM